MFNPSPEVANELDKLMRADLIIGRDMLSNGLSLATKLVAFGLLLEIFELTMEVAAICRRKYDQWILHITFLEHHAPDWAIALAFVGWIFIVVGVVGEWATESPIEDAGITIEQINDELLTQATNEAGDAASSASRARAAARDAKGEADEVRGQARQLKADLAAEDADAKKLQAFVRDQVYGRQLKLNINLLLRNFPPAKVEIWYRGSSDESRDFAFLIRNELEGAKWDVPDTPTGIPEEYFAKHGYALGTGIRIYDKQVDFQAWTPTFAGTLAEARSQGLSEEAGKRLATLVFGIQAQEVDKDPALPDDFFRIVIGAREKPPP